MGAWNTRKDMGAVPHYPQKIFVLPFIINTRDGVSSTRPGSNAASDSDSTPPVPHSRASRLCVDDDDGGPDSIPLFKRCRISHLCVDEDDDKGKTTTRQPICVIFMLSSLVIFIYISIRYRF
jgi:hypothetical protein